VSNPDCDGFSCGWGGKLGSLGVFLRFPPPEPERIRLDEGVAGGKGGCPLGGGGSGGRLCRTDAVDVGVCVGGVPFCLLGNGRGRTDAPDDRPDSCLDASVRADSDPSRTSRGKPSLPRSETSCNGAGLADSSRRPFVEVFCVGELSLDLGRSSAVSESVDLDVRCNEFRCLRNLTALRTRIRSPTLFMPISLRDSWFRSRMTSLLISFVLNTFARCPTLFSKSQRATSESVHVLMSSRKVTPGGGSRMSDSLLIVGVLGSDECGEREEDCLGTFEYRTVLLKEPVGDVGEFACES